MKYKYDEIKSHFEDFINDKNNKDFIKEYENDNFGSVNTDFSDPEKVVNMYVYIIGEDIVSDYRNQLENVA